MATLTSRTVQSTYKDLLQVSNSNAGIDATLRAVEDGEGTSSILSLSTTAVAIDNLQFSGNAIISIDAGGDISITPDSSGDLILDGLKWPQADGSASQVLVTDGAGQLSWSTGSSSSVIVVAGTAGEALTKGDAVYMHTDGKLYKAVNNSTEIMTRFFGFAAANISSGIGGNFHVAGESNSFTGMTTGAYQYLNSTAGGITGTLPSTTGETVFRLGIAMSATKMLIQPQFLFVRG